MLFHLASACCAICTAAKPIARFKRRLGRKPSAETCIDRPTFSAWHRRVRVLDRNQSSESLILTSVISGWRPGCSWYTPWPLRVSGRPWTQVARSFSSRSTCRLTTKIRQLKLIKENLYLQLFFFTNWTLFEACIFTHTLNMLCMCVCIVVCLNCYQK